MDDAGRKVIGCHLDQDRIASPTQGKSPLTHIGDAAITALVGGGFEATDDFSRAAECDALVICVPTPLSKMQEPDLQFVTATMDALAPHLRAGQLLSLESTTWPGPTADVLLPYVTRPGRVPRKDFSPLISPEPRETHR